jgi:hypothetical protein
MAQIITMRNDIKQRFKEAKNLAVAVAASGNTTLLSIPVDGLERIFVQLDVTDNALDAFLIQARCSRDATATTLYSTAGAFTSPVGLLVGASGDLTTQAIGSGWFILDVRGLCEVTILASGNGAATVSIFAGGQ